MLNVFPKSTYSIPSLKNSLDGMKGKDIVRNTIKPDFYNYDESDKNRLNSFISHYEKHTSSYFLITSFSFFESYVKNAIAELIQFHGGASGWVNKIKRDFSNIESKIVKNKMEKNVQSLRRPLKKNMIDKFVKNINILNKHNYVFPSQKMCTYGISKMISRIENISASQIPLFFKEVMDMDITKKGRFNTIRRKRNKIAHGEHIRLSFREARGMAKSLREVAIEIDDFLLKNYFIIEFPR